MWRHQEERRAPREERHQVRHKSLSQARHHPVSRESSRDTFTELGLEDDLNDHRPAPRRDRKKGVASDSFAEGFVGLRLASWRTGCSGGTAQGPSCRSTILIVAAVCLVASFVLVLFYQTGQSAVNRAAGEGGFEHDRTLEVPMEPLSDPAASLSVTAGRGADWRGSEAPVLSGVGAVGAQAALAVSPSPAPVGDLAEQMADLAPVADARPTTAPTTTPEESSTFDDLKPRTSAPSWGLVAGEDSTTMPSTSDSAAAVWAPAALASGPPTLKDCVAAGVNCQVSRCCTAAGERCYEKNSTAAFCKPECRAGPDMTEEEFSVWSCKGLGPRTPGTGANFNWTKMLVPDWVESRCSQIGTNCHDTRCCSEPGHQCFEKNGGWSACRPECVPGPQPDDRADEDWTCKALGPMSPGTAEVFKIRRGSFFVIGDWGRGEGTSGIAQECQTSIAEAMDKKMAELGDVKFVISLGDSFYSEGVLNKDDPEWDKKWRWVYSVDLRSIPWYSVYGERDYRTDPCACTSDDRECAQVSYDEDDFEHFQMPGTSYFHEYPEMGIELVGLDLNNFQNGDRFEGDGSADEVMFSDCFKTSCAFKCLDNMRTRAEASMKLFHERVANSRQKSMVVFSHYPTDHFRSAPRFLDALRNNSARSITYFGARRQTTDQPGVSIEPNAQWVVGGGGGDGCNSSRQGFAVGEIWGDSSITVTPVDVDF
mmetsp:Transcript_30460/g.81533  ORF Transcript_30460/g.81533 Transcript_30460/m.81533 type:complete len:708 (+) Transcript_30460:62-2185(+)